MTAAAVAAISAAVPAHAGTLSGLGGWFNNALNNLSAAFYGTSDFNSTAAYWKATHYGGQTGQASIATYGNTQAYQNGGWTPGQIVTLDSHRTTGAIPNNPAGGIATVPGHTIDRK
jgi:hypothetical protein